MHAEGHVLVKFTPLAMGVVRGLDRGPALERLQHRLGLPAGARLEEPALSVWLRKKHRPTPGTPPVDLNRFLYLRLPKGLSVQQCLERLRHHPLLEYAEADGIGYGGGLIPNDPSFPMQWHHENRGTPGADIKTPDAWDITTGSTNVVVAVLDTGLNLGLDEFAGRIVPGYDFINNDGDPTDDNGHGTAVTGTLAANGNNNQLVAGVNWKCRIMPVKVLDASNFGFYSVWAQGVTFAQTNGAKIINLSAGGSGSNASLTQAIDDAIAADVLFVSITHNQGSSVIAYPGNLAQAITVGATDTLDQRTPFSNFGPQIDLVAPGTNIFTVSRVGSLSRWWGTSFAAPQVSGVCAMLASLKPDITQDEALAFLIQGADDEVGDASDTPGFDNFYGHGRLNALQTLQAALGTASLKINEITMVPGGIELQFQAGPNRTYSVEYSESTFNPAWSLLSNIPSAPTNRNVQVIDTASSAPTRIYRLRTPGE